MHREVPDVIDVDVQRKPVQLGRLLCRGAAAVTITYGFLYSATADDLLRALVVVSVLTCGVFTWRRTRRTEDG